MAIRILPRPKHLIKLAPSASLGDEQFSLDERTFMIYQQIITEANGIEDGETRELYLDALQTFASSGDVKQLLSACEWRRRVVPLDEFLFSPTYLGMDETSTFPAVREALEELDGEAYGEACLKGCIGSGKSTIGNAGIARGVYKLSCMRHPQATYGIQSKSSIVFTIQSVRFNTAKKAVFEEFGAYINHSAYFRTVYPYDKTVTSQMIFREQNVSILPVSSGPTGAISMNVIGGILDEMNFMQKIERSKSSYADMDTGAFDQAKQLYNTLSRRRRSRFTRKGKVPGILFLVSSSRYPDDFTEQKAKESVMCGGTDPTIYVYSHSQWSSKGREHFLPESFRVQIGNDKVRSKILADDAEVLPGVQTIDVPMDFFADFNKDCEGALRDFGGVTVMSAHPFFGKREAIHSCMAEADRQGYKLPFNFEEIDLSIGMPRPDKDRLRLDVDSFRTFISILV